MNFKRHLENITHDPGHVHYYTICRTFPVHNFMPIFMDRLPDPSTKMVCLLLSGILFIASVHVSRAQSYDSFRIGIKKTSSSMVVDGLLNEEAWKEADVAKNFYRVLPMDTGFAESKTEVFLTYSEDKLYLAAICYDNLPGDDIVESLRRDFSFGGNSNFLVFIDPFDDKTNGFSFGASRAGAQWDGLLADGGGTGVDLKWDNKWELAVTDSGDKWIIEMAIPFKTMRYKEGIKTWGINFSRMDLKRNEKSSWTPIHRQFATSSLAFTGVLEWDAPPPTPGTNISVIPYMLGSASKDFENKAPGKQSFDAGLDAKIAVTSSLNLDLTLNPDFAQAEVDEQITNLDRFELFFPEKRQFFLENSDLFANFGFSRTRPFFSRRIGLESPIIAGARMSGKINKDWRIGLMNIATSKVDSSNVPAQNYTVAAIQRRVFSRSNIALIMTNRDAINLNNLLPDSTATFQSQYNRLIGLDYNLASKNNVWTGKFLVHKSFTPGVNNQDYAHGVNLTYKTQTFKAEWNHEIVGSNFNAEMGFVPRTGYYKIAPGLAYDFYPKSTVINRHGPRIENTTFWNKNWQHTDNEFEIRYDVLWLNRASAQVEYTHFFVRLQTPFDPTNSGGLQLNSGSEFDWSSIRARFTSDARKRFNYVIQTSYGGFYNGDRTSVHGQVAYRYQPYGSLSVSFTYNNIQLPAPYSDAEFVLVGPKLDLTFTDKIFFTTFIQYNNQTDNLNLNSRFQWRFKPVSDFFIIYTDNYFPDNLAVKNRAIVVKLNYWLNL